MAKKQIASYEKVSPLLQLQAIGVLLEAVGDNPSAVQDLAGYTTEVGRLIFRLARDAETAANEAD